jgi:hypothetical protein
VSSSADPMKNRGVDGIEPDPLYNGLREFIQFSLESYQWRAVFLRAYTPSDTQSDHHFHSPSHRLCYSNSYVDKAGRHNYRCSFRSPFHTVCTPAHSTFSHTLRHFNSNSTSSTGVEVVSVKVEVVLDDAATKHAVI